MCHMYKSSQNWDQGPKQKRDIFVATKNYTKKKLQDENQNQEYL